MVNSTTLNGTVETAQSYVYTAITGIVILLIGFAVGILIQRLLYKLLQEVRLNRIMSKVGVTYNLEKWISSVVSYIIYVFTIILFLDQLGLRSIVLYIISGAVLMLLILTLLVGLKDIIPNFVAWIVLQRKDKIKEGYSIDVKEISGVVEKIGFLEMEIKTPNGDILYVPNSLFLKSKFKIKK